MTNANSALRFFLKQNVTQRRRPGQLAKLSFIAFFAFVFVASINHEATAKTKASLNSPIAIRQKNIVKIRLPKGRPAQFEIKFKVDKQVIKINFYKASARGPHTRIMVDEGKGNLAVVDQGEDGKYVGHCEKWPGLRIQGQLTAAGLAAKIDNPGSQSLMLSPIEDSKQHKITYQPPEKTLSQIAKKIFTDDVSINGLKQKFQSKATLKPKFLMECYEYEIGVEIGSRAFTAESAYQSNLTAAKKIAVSTSTNLDKRYLHATGIKHTIGTVLIRTDPASDPLRESVTATGGGRAARSSLVAFRDYWNAHPEIVGKTHDLACYHTFYAPSGLAYVNSVGGRQRYATVGGRGATSWADGTLCHEFGHSWGLKHTNDSGLFYESKPRSNQGADVKGGQAKRMSVMVGDSGNIGRLASDEAAKVISNRSNKIRHGEPFTPGPTKPFGKRDDLKLLGPTAIIDVIENDYDVNNDVLDVALLDTVSYRGGRLSLSIGTGPGGRNEIRYSAPAGGLNGNEDFFHYTVFDTSGRTDFGAVYVTSTIATVDLNDDHYDYDLGPAKSPTKAGFSRITPDTTGDIQWENRVLATDRGKSKRVNAINQDLIYSSRPSTLRHKIANGIWTVTLNMGDSAFGHDQMGLIAENRRISRKIDSEAGKFVYVDENGGSLSPVSFDVVVKDGWLDLRFLDHGGKDKNWVVTRLTLHKKSDRKD